MFFDIFYGVDGTGDANDDVYRRNFAQSFVQNFRRCYAWGWSGYERGPTVWGQETGPSARRASQLVSAQYRAISKTHGQTPRIFLSGYSRGGAAVIHAAQILGEAGIPVHALLLFDAVDRSVTVPFNWSITPNVAHVRHAMRSPTAFSRISFGNCGTSAEDDVRTDFKKKEFFCTHGAMGGLYYTPGEGQTSQSLVSEPHVPILAGTNVTFAQDKAGAEAVAVWMQTEHSMLRH